MQIRIIGAGVMGRGIAQWAATAGHVVELADLQPESIVDALRFINDLLARSVTKGRLTSNEAEQIRNRIIPLDLIDAPGNDVDLVIEAIREDASAKTDLFGRLERVLPSTTIFSTNTSSLSVTQIAASLQDPGRLIGLHFFNPAPLMRIVEVIPGVHTRRDITRILVDLVSGTGHRAVVVADTPGFLVNHAGRGLITEALALSEESVADVATIDSIARDVLGLRMGPFELTDLTGLDITASVITTVWAGFTNSDRLRPSYLTENRLAAGVLGRKTGREFYEYGAAETVRHADPVITGDPERPMWVSGDRQHATDLRQLLRANGAALEENEEPSDAAVVLVPTWGRTTAHAVASERLPPSRTLGFDPLSLTGARRVLAVTPATDPVSAQDAAAAIARVAPGEEPPSVSLIRDTAGSVAQRLLSSIISVAASIAERSIATPDDIDNAVTIGLGYPYGPLAWGDRLGAGALLELQRGLHRTTGDPRHRPTSWVTERAQLGLPLTHPHQEIAS